MANTYVCVYCGAEIEAGTPHNCQVYRREDDASWGSKTQDDASWGS